MEERALQFTPLPFYPPREKVPGTRWIRGWLFPRADLDDVDKRKFLILLGLELRPSLLSSMQLVTMQTELSRILIHKGIIICCFLLFIGNVFIVYIIYPYTILAVSSTVVQCSDFLATDPDVQVRFPALIHFLESSECGTGPTQPREFK
jgi:hypothetical protein